LTNEPNDYILIMCAQFVAFRDFIGGKYGNDLSRSQAMLAKEVLAEIPDQFVSYMVKQGITPNPPRYEEAVGQTRT
jgi:Copine